MLCHISPRFLRIQAFLSKQDFCHPFLQESGRAGSGRVTGATTALLVGLDANKRHWWGVPPLAEHPRHGSITVFHTHQNQTFWKNIKCATRYAMLMCFTHCVMGVNGCFTYARCVSSNDVTNYKHMSTDVVLYWIWEFGFYSQINYTIFR